jgi:hypothetical protein
MLYYLRTSSTSAPLAQGAAAPLAEGAAVIRLATFVVGTLLLCGLSTIAGDPLWTPWSSLVAAVAAYLTAPRVFAVWVGPRKVTLLSILLWYIGAALPFDITQLVCTGTWRLGWAVGNLAGATVLFLGAGLVWSLDLRRPRYLLPAAGAVAIGVLALLAWSWP